MQNLRRGHYELAVDAPTALRIAADAVREELTRADGGGEVEESTGRHGFATDTLIGLPSPPARTGWTSTRCSSGPTAVLPGP